MTYRTSHNSLKFLNYIKFKNRSGTFLTPCNDKNAFSLHIALKIPNKKLIKDINAVNILDIMQDRNMFIITEKLDCSNYRNKGILQID